MISDDDNFGFEEIDEPSDLPKLTPSQEAFIATASKKTKKRPVKKSGKTYQPLRKRHLNLQITKHTDKPLVIQKKVDFDST